MEKWFERHVEIAADSDCILFNARKEKILMLTKLM